MLGWKVVGFSLVKTLFLSLSSLFISQVKGELRRPVYKALVELLQEDDAAVQVSRMRHDAHTGALLSGLDSITA